MLRHGLAALFAAVFLLLPSHAGAQAVDVTFADTYGRYPANPNPMGDVFVGMDMGTNFMQLSGDVFDNTGLDSYALSQDMFNGAVQPVFSGYRPLFHNFRNPLPVPAEPLFHYHQ
ncbi:MAG: hypothetical protein GC131_08535 [Alphaproteobacteria bacterium]|nr:hypothetical protein [Alphaproteobacteria bacterium]